MCLIQVSVDFQDSTPWDTQPNVGEMDLVRLWKQWGLMSR